MQKETLLALSNNLASLDKHQKDVANSAGSAKAMMDNAYDGSIDAKVNDMKRSFEELYSTILNSKTLGTGLDMLSSGVQGISKAFSSIPTIVALATAGFTIFNSKFRESIQMFANMFPPMNNLNNKITQLGEKWKASSVMNQGYATTLKQSITTMQTAGVSTAGFGTKLALLNTKIALARIGMVALQVATMAMQVAMSMGLSIVITAVVSAVDNLIHKNEKLAESNAKYAESIKSNEEVISSTNKLVEEKSKLETQMNNSKLTEKESLELKTKLVDVERQIALALPESANGYDLEGKKISTNNGLIQKSLDLKKEQILLEAKAVLSKNNNPSESKANIDKIKADIEGFNASEAKNNNPNTKSKDKHAYYGKSNGGHQITKEDKFGTDGIDTLIENLKTAETNANSTKQAILSLMNQGNTAKDIAGMKELGWSAKDVSVAMKELGYTDEQVRQSSNGVTVALDNTKVSTDELGKSTEGLDPKLNSLEQQAKATEDAFKKMSDAFSQANDNIKLLESVRDEFSKSGGVLSGETIEKMFASGNTDIIALLGNKNTLMDESNRLLGTEKTSRDQNYESIIKESMATRDKTKSTIDGANSEIKATSDTTNNNATQYGADANNKANAEASKTKASGEAASIMFENGKGITTALGGLYGTDVTNKINGENAKGSAVGKVNNGILSSNANTVNQLGGMYKTDSDNFRQSQQDKLNAMMTGFDVTDAFAFERNSNALKDAEANKKFYDFKPNSPTPSQPKSIGGGDYNPVMAGYNPVGIGNVGNSGGSGGSGASEKAVAKEVENMKDLRKRYYELDNTIADLNGRYSLLGTIKENTYGKQYVNYLNDEIESLKKQQQAVSNLADAVKTERYELQRDLGGTWGFTFGGQGEITNYQNQLKTLQDRANAMSGDAKENQIKAIEEVSSKLEKYTDLTINKTNEMGNQWYELSNKIKDSYKAMVDAVATKEKEVADVITYYAEKNVKTKQDAIDRQIDAVNKMYDKEDKEVDLSKKKKELTELKSEMDKFQFATDKIGINKFKALQEQYKTLEEDMNNTIRDTQKQATLDAMNKEKDDLGKSLEEYLKPENINKIIEASLKSGMIDLMGNVVSLNEANAQMLKETEIGYTNVASKTKEWKDYLSNIIAMYPQLANITSNLGYNIDRTAPINLGTGSIDVSNLSTGVSNSGINISMPFTINGDVNDKNMNDIKVMLDTGMTKVKKEIMTAFGNR